MYRPHTTLKNAIRFTGKTTLFQRYFQTLNTWAAITTFSSNVHQFCKPKSSCFMRETAVKRIQFFLEFFMLHEVYDSTYWKFMEKILQVKLFIDDFEAFCDINFKFCTKKSVGLKGFSSALLISRYILGLGQRGHCCFCAACPNRRCILRLEEQTKGFLLSPSSNSIA